MQQGHPRHKQLDRARHEMEMYNRRRANELWNSLSNTFRVIYQTVKEAAKSIHKAINIHQDNKPSMPEYTIDEFMVDSGLGR